MTDLASAFVPLAVADRSGFDESVHHGAVVVLDRDGSIAHHAGDPHVEIYPRSSNKPMQADAMLALGLELDPQQLALACASHDGTDRHLAVVRTTLAAAGLDDSALGNTASYPLQQAAMEAAIRAGAERSRIFMNCSGKHAAMVAVARLQGWDVDRYLDVEHPLQAAITKHLIDLAGPVAHIGVDGCGAPAHVLSLHDLAVGFRNLAMRRGPVWEAMTEFPELVGGDERTVTKFMRAVPGAMAKDGAQGVFALALPDGRAAALKIADGQERPVGAVLANALTSVGIEVDGAALTEPVLGHGEPVGTVRAIC